jgi:outer membrane protein
LPFDLARGVKGSAALAGLAVLAAAGARADTLAEAVALAYQSNPQLQAQRATLRATDENYIQAEAGYRPQASVQAQVTTNENNEQFGVPISGNNQGANAVLTVTQPIYTGGRVASQVTGAQATILAGRETLRATEEAVLQQVIQAYVDTRRDMQAVEIDKANVILLERQLDESRARFAVGDITRTDVAETEGRVAAAVAQLSTAQAQLANSRAEYSAIVGQNPGELAPEPSLAKFLPASLEEAQNTAENLNPQIGQQDYAEQASAAKVAQAKAQARPTVSLQTSYGEAGGAFGITSPFANFGRGVTAALVFQAPIFSGGSISSQVRQAAENNNADRINIETARRQALFQVSSAWNQLLGSRATLKAEEEAVRAANIAFEGMRQEARVGDRTTLDVLITEQDLSNAELALLAARHDEYMAGATLLSSMGMLRVEDLAPGTPEYDPAANLHRIRHLPGSVPWEAIPSAIDHMGAPTVVQRPAPP